jgi:hypothetical protein
MKMIFKFCGPAGALLLTLLTVVFLTGNKLKVVPKGVDEYTHIDFGYFTFSPYVGDSGLGMTEFIKPTRNFVEILNQNFEPAQREIVEDPRNWKLTWVGPGVLMSNGNGGFYLQKKVPDNSKEKQIMPWEIVSAQ